MAHGVLESLVAQPPYHGLIGKVDSCGTGAYHVGSGPDSRTMSTLKAHGITDYQHVARKVCFDMSYEMRSCGEEHIEPWSIDTSTRSTRPISSSSTSSLPWTARIVSLLLVSLSLCLLLSFSCPRSSQCPQKTNTYPGPRLYSYMPPSVRTCVQYRTLPTTTLLYTMYLAGPALSSPKKKL